MPDIAEDSQRQENVVAALQSRAPKLAGAYRMTLQLLATPAVEGCEAARVSMICHGIRELMNGLPTVLSDSFISRPNPSSDTLTRQLPELLAKHPDVTLDQDQDLIPIPRSVASALQDIISTVAQEKGRNRSNAAALVTGSTDVSHPAVAQWMTAQRFFLRWTHLDRNHERARDLPSDEELLSQIRIIEDIIVVRSTLFFDNLHTLNDLLSEINGEDAGGA